MSVKKISRIIISLLILMFAMPANAYVCKYKEDFYRLFHVHYAQYPDDCIENIYWLEKAVNADFANPLYANAKIANQEQWEKYRCLFMMHLNLKLIEQHLRLGRIYDKKQAYFYDAPFKDEYLRNLDKARDCYNAGYYYWEEAKIWAEKANVGKFRFMFVTDCQDWEDERERIVTGSLDYKKILDRELTRMAQVREKLESFPSKDF